MRVTTSRGTDGIVSGQSGRIPHTGAGLLYGATQGAVERVTGSSRYPPLTWWCANCGRQVTDRAGAGRPVHIEHGHAGGCAWLARDQAADTAARRARLPGLIAASESAIGTVRRHRLARPLIDDCPRCGWSGYFHEYLATIDGDWGNAVCDNCYADLHPAITVSVRFLSARSAGREEPFAVIRERTRSDYRFPDLGQQLTGSCPGSTPPCSWKTSAVKPWPTSSRAAVTGQSRSRRTWPGATGHPTRPSCPGSNTPTRSKPGHGRRECPARIITNGTVHSAKQVMQG